MTDNQKFALLVFALVLLAVVALVVIYVRGNLNEMVGAEVRQTYDQMRTVP